MLRQSWPSPLEKPLSQHACARGRGALVAAGASTHAPRVEAKGFTLSLGTDCLRPLFCLLTRPCEKNREYTTGSTYPHIRNHPQKIKNRKDNDGRAFATQQSPN